MTQLGTLRKRVLQATLSLSLTLGTGQAMAQDLRLAAPSEMVESGFLAHILPRFKLKHRIAVTPVAPEDEADMVLAQGQGVQVFADGNGGAYGLNLIAVTPQTEKFADWMQSAPGKSAIESFPRGGPSLYSTTIAAEAEIEAPEITGDAATGSQLALVHCGRCHVVDKRNRMGGIGSTPSFAAMRARPHWFDLFNAYWTQNPHPSFTEVIGVTEPFSATNVTHVAPVRITLDEIDAIVAFVEGITPLNLGAPVQFD